MKPLALFLCLVLALLAGCKGKPKELSPTEKLAVENLISEAQFALQIREYSRAEELFQRAITLREDFPEYWVLLGMARRRQDNLDGARKAYKHALELHKERYDREKKDEDLAQQAWVLALLGRTDDALKFLEQSLKDHPDSAVLRQMADPRGLPRTFQTAQFKELAL